MSGFLSSNQFQTGSSTSLSYYFVLGSTNQTINGGSNVIFPVVTKTNGSNILYNSTTGIFTLAANGTYKLTANLQWTYTSGGNLFYAWINTANSSQLGTGSGSGSNTGATSAGFQFGTAIDYVTTNSSAMTVAVNIIYPSSGSLTVGHNASANIVPWAEIVQVS